MLKKYSLILGIGLVLSACLDNTVPKFLGQDIFNLINHADSIEVLRLNPLSEDSTAVFYLGYAVQDTSPNLSKSQVAYLSKIIKDKASYSFDSVTKNCTLLPDYALVFYGSNLQKRKDTLSILLDFHCDMWNFIYHDIRKFEDMKSSRDSLLALVNTVLPQQPKEALDTTKIAQTILSKDTTEKDTTKFKISPLMQYTEIQTVFLKDLEKKVHKVQAFILDPEADVRDSLQSFNGFTVVRQLDSLQLNHQDTLLKIITDTTNYPIIKSVKNCTFLPDVGYRLYRMDSTFTDLLIAFYCNDWMFIRADKRVIRDCQKARQALLKVTRQIFP